MFKTISEKMTYTVSGNDGNLVTYSLKNSEKGCILLVLILSGLTFILIPFIPFIFLGLCKFYRTKNIKEFEAANKNPEPIKETIPENNNSATGEKNNSQAINQSNSGDVGNSDEKPQEHKEVLPENNNSVTQEKNNKKTTKKKAKTEKIEASSNFETGIQTILDQILDRNSLEFDSFHNFIKDKELSEINYGPFKIEKKYENQIILNFSLVESNALVNGKDAYNSPEDNKFWKVELAALTAESKERALKFTAYHIGTYLNKVYWKQENKKIKINKVEILDQVIKVILNQVN